MEFPEMSAGIALNLETSGPVVSAPATSPQPRLWTPFATWLVAAIVGQMAVIAAFVAGGVCIGIVMGAQGYEAGAIQQRAGELLNQPLPMMLLSILPFQLGMALVVGLAARWSKEPLRERLGLVAPVGLVMGRSRLASLGAFSLATALTVAIVLSMIWGTPATNSTGATVAEGSWVAVLITGLVLSLIPAVIEEVVFRGYIQRRLLERWSPTAAIGVSTLLFAILHADSLQHILAVIPLGVITGLLAYRTKSVNSGIVVHAVHNAGAVAFGAIFRILGPMLGDTVSGVAVIGSILALAAVGLPALIALVRGNMVLGQQGTKSSDQPSLSQPAVVSLGSRWV
jgi:membrane protease YdiL (CAAX protease family)